MKNDNELFIGGDPRFLSGAGLNMRASTYDCGPVTIPTGATVLTSRTIGFERLANIGPINALVENGVAVRRGKLPYHHRPHLNVFLRPGEWPSAGVELETEERTDIDKNAMETALQSNWFHFESDSSLCTGNRSGYELITDPLPPRFYRNPRLWAGLQNILTPWVESWAFAQTGLHVHVGLTQFEEMKDELGFFTTLYDRRAFAKYLIAYLYFMVVDRTFSDRIFLRKPGSYCHTPSDIYPLPVWKPGMTGASVVQDVLAAVCQYSVGHGRYTDHTAKLSRLATAGTLETTAASARRRMNMNELNIAGNSLPEAIGLSGTFSGHGSEVNMGNSQTIEFRRGKGTLNAVSILQMVEFATLLVRFAAKMLKRPNDPVGPKEICRYMAENTTSGALKILAEQQMKGG
jgi:hypothetical protein